MVLLQERIAIEGIIEREDCNYPIVSKLGISSLALSSLQLVAPLPPSTMSTSECSSSSTVRERRALAIYSLQP
ncbi:hypothetical protein HPP92_024754 [Vanilla planifolia]|uniref:Uncharacterized protein n=1 Tax=Vanilla planifolia TaxID=51239 RepID=A0A835PPW4_VANPL|nr:hypothetical protein HPP92_024754 [Vanilla planifolia]